MNLSEEIYRILTKRKYNRDKPYLDAVIRSLIGVVLANNGSLRLVGFWGVGSKKEPNWADEESCAFLCSLNQEIKNIYSPGIEFTFIFATLHGIHNGYSRNDIDSYVRGMITIFNKYEFKYVFLEPLWAKYGITFQKIESELSKKPADWWKLINERELIEYNASIRNRNYSPSLSAQKYYVMRDLEKEMIEKEFFGYIFHAFSDPSLQVVLPNMPTLYFYGRESWSNAPWFVDSKKGSSNI